MLFGLQFSCDEDRQTRMFKFRTEGIYAQANLHSSYLECMNVPEFHVDKVFRVSCFFVNHFQIVNDANGRYPFSMLSLANDYC